MKGVEHNYLPLWYARNKTKGNSLARSSNSPSSFNQSSIMQYILSNLTLKQTLCFQKQMEIYFCSTGISFQRMENVHLKNAIKSLCGDDCLLPQRRQLADDSHLTLQYAPFSAASESNFYTIWFVHTKLRNRISVKTLENLLFLNTNLSTSHEQDISSDDYEDEVSDYDCRSHGKWVLTTSIWLGYYWVRYWSFVCQTVIKRRLIIKY